jgi:acetyl esterase/lipase
VEAVPPLSRLNDAGAPGSDIDNSLRAAGRDVELTEYPDASHAFDNPLGAQPAAVSPKFESVRNCKIHEEADGFLINAETKWPFTYLVDG